MSRLRASSGSMCRLSYVVAMVFVGSTSALAAGPPIDRIELKPTARFGLEYYSAAPYGSGLMVIGHADVYHLHDGSIWLSGAGSTAAYYTKMSSVSTHDSEIEFGLDHPIGSLVFFRIDYNGGEHSSYGQLVSSGPLVLRATNGSTTATLSGYATLTANEPANITDDRFSYFNAPTGWWVPFELTYTLANGLTWSPTTMDGIFSYYLTGELNFTNAIVPEPWFLPCQGAMLVLMGMMRRRR